MGEKISQYPDATANPDLASLLDISEKIGASYVTKKITMQYLVNIISSASSVTIPMNRIPFGDENNLLSTNINFTFYKSLVTSVFSNRSTILLRTVESDNQSGESRYGAGQTLIYSTDALLEATQENKTTNLNNGSRLALYVRDSSLGSGNYCLSNQVIGQVQFGVNKDIIGAIVRAKSEQSIVNLAGSGSSLEFLTTSLNTTTPSVQMKINNAGKVNFKNYGIPLAVGTIHQTLNVLNDELVFTGGNARTETYRYSFVPTTNATIYNDGKIGVNWSTSPNNSLDIFLVDNINGNFRVNARVNNTLENRVLTNTTINGSITNIVANHRVDIFSCPETDTSFSDYRITLFHATSRIELVIEKIVK